MFKSCSDISKLSSIWPRDKCTQHSRWFFQRITLLLSGSCRLQPESQNRTLLFRSVDHTPRCIYNRAGGSNRWQYRTNQVLRRCFRTGLCLLSHHYGRGIRHTRILCNIVASGKECACRDGRNTRRDQDGNSRKIPSPIQQEYVDWWAEILSVSLRQCSPGNILIPSQVDNDIRSSHHYFLLDQVCASTAEHSFRNTNAHANKHHGMSRLPKHTIWTL